MSAVTVTKLTPTKADQIRVKFGQLLERTNQENPRPQDVEALTDLLNGNKGLELWREVLSAAQFAERAVIDTSPAVAGVKECWRQRLASLRNELGYQDAPLLEQLLIQHAALCWLRLSLLEIQHAHVMKQSITMNQGLYWEKRLSIAQRRFTRSCETLARARKLSKNTPALQFNIAAAGGQQVNLK